MTIHNGAPDGTRMRAIGRAGRLSVSRPRQHRLDVDDRRAVYRFERMDVKAAARVDPEHRDLVQPDRIRAIGRSRREDARQWPGAIAARMHFEHSTIRLMQPGEYENRVPRGQAAHRAGKSVLDSSQAAAPPSSPCFGASSRLRSGERTTPINCSEQSVVDMML